MNARRARMIRQLRDRKHPLDTRTADLMEADPTMSMGQAMQRVHAEMLDEQEAAYRAEYGYGEEDPKPEPKHWGEDPWCLANVGLN